MAFRTRGPARDGGHHLASEIPLGRLHRPGLLVASGSAARPPAALAKGPVRIVAKRPSGSLLILRKTELALSGQARDVPRRSLRVPLAAIVHVTAKAAPTEVLRLAAPARRPDAAADAPVASPPRRGRAALLLREAVTLALFVATLAGMYYLGRTHGFQNVIIVPEPWNRHSALG